MAIHALGGRPNPRILVSTQRELVAWGFQFPGLRGGLDCARGRLAVVPTKEPKKAGVVGAGEKIKRHNQHFHGPGKGGALPHHSSDAHCAETGERPGAAHLNLIQC